MALIDSANITELTNRLGASELDLATAKDIAVSNSAMERLAAARDYVYDMGTTLTGTEFDNILALATSLRGSERTMMEYLETTLEDSVNALDTYFNATVGTGMRAYYTGLAAATTVNWNVNFRKLWRRIKQEELVIALASASNSAGTWTVSYDADGIELPSVVTIRTEALVGASDIIVTLVLDVDDTTTATIGINIPSETVADTAFVVRNTLYNEFIGVSSMTITGGTNGDSIKLWIAT
jgi:hypothetical protein